LPFPASGLTRVNRLAGPGTDLEIRLAISGSDKEQDQYGCDNAPVDRANRHYVMDSKGETIYRRRPFYYVLEGLTGGRMKAGLIPDTIPERLVETQTPLATVRRMPRVAADFIRKNYIQSHFAFQFSVRFWVGAMRASASISPCRVFTQLLPSAERLMGIASPDRYELRLAIMKFAGQVAPASWLYCGRKQQQKGIIHFRPLSQISGPTRIKSSDLRNAGFSPFLAARLMPDRFGTLEFDRVEADLEETSESPRALR
jgi:hypothetical protein